MATAHVDDDTSSSHAKSAYYKRNTTHIAVAILILVMFVLISGVAIRRTDTSLMGAIALCSFLVAAYVWFIHDLIVSTRLATTPDGLVTIKKAYLWRVVTVNTTLDAISGSFVRWKFNEPESGTAVNALTILMRDGSKIDVELGYLPDVINLGLHLQSSCGIPYLAD